MINNVNNNSYTKKFIDSANKVSELEKNGNFITRNITSTTALIPSGGIVLGYELKILQKSLKLKKLNKTIERQKLIEKFDKTFPWVVAGGVALFLVLQYMFNRNSEEKFKKIKNTFNEINTTNAKLQEQPIYSRLVGARYNTLSGEIIINKRLINDPIMNWQSKKILKHELVHARQAETIARMEDGIEKLNYALIKCIAGSIKTPEDKLKLQKLYNDIMSNSDKYKNTEVVLQGVNVNLKNHIEAIHTLVTNKNATYKDIPMVINTEHYKEVRKAKGELTQEEKIMAQKYYEAQLNYPIITSMQALNPLSDYWNNLLEVEAYKENPGIYTFIRGIFNKH